MAKETINITPEQMKQITRYEITYKDILGGCPPQDADLVYPEGCSYTLEDLYQALKGLQAADPLIKEFGGDWFDPITQRRDAFDLDRACGLTEDPDDLAESVKGYPGLETSDAGYFKALWQELEDAWIFGEDSKKLSEVLDLDTVLTDFERFLANRGKPIDEWVFSTEEMETYIRFFTDDQFVKNAEEPQLQLARKFIDKLSAEDNVLALHTKGYACYGGNRLYPCDWVQSRDCMLRLFALQEDPNYANTLGYIYYYGRCTDGVPEYEKAFPYFVIAASHGLYEGTYKLADMFCHGYACPKSERTAKTLYNKVYLDSRDRFLEGHNTNFADAALRMGNVFAKGIGEDVDIITALYYYTQADYAARLRAEEDDFFGNKKVVKNIQQAIEEILPQLPDDYFESYIDYDEPESFEALVNNNNRCTLTRSTDPTGRTVLIAERLPAYTGADPSPILITIPHLRLCERTTKIRLFPDEDAEIWFAEDAAEVRYDFCEWNDVEDRYEFYYEDELTAWIRSGKYRFYGKPRKA